MDTERQNPFDSPHRLEAGIINKGNAGSILMKILTTQGNLNALALASWPRWITAFPRRHSKTASKRWK
jgi:hypothetical protein